MAITRSSGLPRFVLPSHALSSTHPRESRHTHRKRPPSRGGWLPHCQSEPALSLPCHAAEDTSFCNRCIRRRCCSLNCSERPAFLVIFLGGNRSAAVRCTGSSAEQQCGGSRAAARVLPAGCPAIRGTSGHGRAAAAALSKWAGGEVFCRAGGAGGRGTVFRWWGDIKREREWRRRGWLWWVDRHGTSHGVR